MGARWDKLKSLVTREPAKLAAPQVNKAAAILAAQEAFEAEHEAATGVKTSPDIRERSLRQRMTDAGLA